MYYHQNKLNTPQRAVLVLKHGGCKRYLLYMIVLIFRFLTSRNYQISMNFIYRIPPSTVHSIIISTYEATCNKLYPTKLPQPAEAEGKKKAEEFCSLWQ